MTFAHVGGNLDLRGATLANLDLFDASVAADLRLGGPYKSAVVWKGKKGEPGTLTLRNGHVGNLMAAKDAWPNQGTSVSMGSSSIISADLKAKPDRKCTRGEWTGGTIGRGSTPSIVQLPTRASLPH
jgi:hypothetical protein